MENIKMEFYDLGFGALVIDFTLENAETFISHSVEIKHF